MWAGRGSVRHLPPGIMPTLTVVTECPTTWLPPLPFTSHSPAIKLKAPLFLHKTVVGDKIKLLE